MRAFLISLLIATACPLFGQQIVFDLGRVSTRFDYEDSEGKATENLHPSRNFSYAAGFRNHLGGAFFWSAMLSYNRYGMEGSDPLYDNRYKWDVSYLGADLGMDFEFLKKKQLRLHARLEASPQFMLEGTQQINNQIYDLKGVEQFDKPFLFGRGGLGATYCADNRVAVSLRYMYGKGFPMGKSNDGEVLRLNTHTVTIGVLVSLKYCSYCFKTHFNKKES